MSHPVHPKCPGCQKPLYKRIDSGKVKKSEPYDYCRNKSCERYWGREAGKVLTIRGDGFSSPKSIKAKPVRPKPEKKPKDFPKLMASTPEHPVVEIVEKEPVPIPPPPLSRKGKALPRRAKSVTKMPSPEKAKVDITSEPVEKARARLKEALGVLIPKEASKAAVGLVLAILSQETGNHKAANVLIDELKLEEMFGIKKVETSTNADKVQA